MNNHILDEHGIDSQKGIARCMGDAAFYADFLQMFLEDTAFARAKQALEQKDYTTMFRSLHELKGVCGNAEMTALYRSVSTLVELLRYDNGAQDEIRKLFDKIETEYNRAVEGIKLANEPDES